MSALSAFLDRLKKFLCVVGTRSDMFMLKRGTRTVETRIFRSVRYIECAYGRAGRMICTTLTSVIRRTANDIVNIITPAPLSGYWVEKSKIVEQPKEAKAKFILRKAICDLRGLDKGWHFLCSHLAIGPAYQLRASMMIVHNLS